MPTLRLLATLPLLVIAAASCAAPLQNGGVDVRPGVAARLEMMCRYRQGDSAPLCADTDE
jgi:hypothetical protein